MTSSILNPQNNFPEKNQESNSQSIESISKTPEQLLEEKKSLFNEHPEEFFHISEFIIAVRKINNSLQTIIGQSNRTELEAAVTRVQYEVMRLFDLIELKKAKDAQSKIIKPGGNNSGHGIMDFARRFKK